jgi:hypothetical protein
VKENYTIHDALQGKSAQVKALILNDRLITQIYVCLYLCPGHCDTDATCPWRSQP